MAEKLGFLARGERAARFIVLGVGAGLVAWVLGVTVTSGVVDPAFVAWAPSVGEWPEAVRIVVYALTLHVWQLVVLPIFGWLVGRTLPIPITAWALVASLGGEMFSVLSETATGGLEGLAPSWSHATAIVMTFAAGFALVRWCGLKGVEAAHRPVA